ncbi:MAG: hypothetical protein P0Y53_15155 [Candidatus Pseudobacter hemicellulosilyticus]|uniref:DUF5018 domain-containing protein n=1 Tax=Candidatus Pseudobacter hemicellulosilyticus TaxID=3121375 RepID=A0AAJ6BFL7_9BACT|nr:MAG: hypothetical protein P0Y53_15155 [Pseudobacter sp.]
MKLTNIFLVMFLLVGIASCTKEAELFNRVQVNEVKMLSFGFYEADNPGVLLKDYVVSQISATAVSVLMPDNIDKSSLVARFTVGENDIVRVNGTVQKSGETVNNFTVPVDYILSDDDNNAKYTVTIGKGGDYIWSAIPFTINDSATTIMLKVNPVTGNPFIMFNQSRTSSADQKVAMVTYEDNVWTNLGEISDGRIGSYYDFTFNSAGIPYASYPDYTATVAQNATVKKLDGAGWAEVGAKGFTTSRISYNALAFTEDEAKLMLFGTVDVAGGALTRRELGVSTFENGSWTTNTTIPGRSSAIYGYLPVARKKNGAIYLGVFNASSPNSVSLYKYANNTWTVLADQWRDANATAMNIRDFDIEVDDEGNVYAAFADNSSTSLYKYRVIKYTEATQSVAPLGTYIAGASGNLFSFDLALSPNGVPYLFYRNSSNYPSIVSFDNDSQDWSQPHTFEAEVGDELTMDFAPNGEAYLAYLKNRKLFVYKYSAP